MPSFNSIPCDKLERLIGVPHAPTVIDVRSDAAFAEEPRLIPGAIRRSAANAADWAVSFGGRRVVVTCREGHALSHGVAAWLRQAGAEAEVLEGGVAAWAKAGLPLVPQGDLPPRDAFGRTVWVTRSRPKVDRIACPWLIRRFVDPQAQFLFVPTEEVANVAERFNGAAFDIAGDVSIWTHDGERCTFDVMVERFGLATIEPLAHLALIVRGADTGRPDIVPEAAGLAALSLGLSRMFDDDVVQLDAGMLIYDALYRWCRDATSERHDWISHQPKGARAKPVEA